MKVLKSIWSLSLSPSLLRRCIVKDRSASKFIRRELATEGRCLIHEEKNVSCDILDSRCWIVMWCVQWPLDDNIVLVLPMCFSPQVIWMLLLLRWMSYQTNIHYFWYFLFIWYNSVYVHTICNISTRALILSSNPHIDDTWINMIAQSPDCLSMIKLPPEVRCEVSVYSMIIWFYSVPHHPISKT